MAEAPELRIGGVGGPALGLDRQVERALGAEGQPVLRRLAVDQVAGARGIAVSRLGADAVRLLADHQQQPEAAGALGEQLLGEP